MTGFPLHVGLSTLPVPLRSIDVVCCSLSVSCACLCPNRLEKKALILPFFEASRLLPLDRLGGDSRLVSMSSTKSGWGPKHRKDWMALRKKVRSSIPRPEANRSSSWMLATHYRTSSSPVSSRSCTNLATVEPRPAASTHSSTSSLHQFIGSILVLVD